MSDQAWEARPDAKMDQQFQMSDQAWEARLDAKMDAILAKHIAGLNGSHERVDGVQDMRRNDD